VRQFVFSYSHIPISTSPAFPDRRSTPRPYLALNLINGTRQFKCYALIDSGADDCIFPASFAVQLGLQIPSGRRYPYGGAGDGTQQAYFFDLEMEIVAVSKLTVPIGFSAALDKFGHGLLGQNGFFNQVDVGFNLAAGTFVLHLP
jgi:hypothetical protein